MFVFVFALVVVSLAVFVLHNERGVTANSSLHIFKVSPCYFSKKRQDSICLIEVPEILLKADTETLNGGELDVYRRRCDYILRKFNMEFRRLYRLVAPMSPYTKSSVFSQSALLLLANIFFIPHFCFCYKSIEFRPCL